MGGDDLLSCTNVGHDDHNTFFGDAGGDMLDFAHGGNDTLDGTNNVAGNSNFFGDAGGNMGGHSVGGDDTFLSSGQFGKCLAYGDALTMSDKAHGGNDTLKGTDGSGSPFVSVLVGDAQTMSDNARGGCDTLISGTGNDDMWGDAQVMLGNARGGNDRFVFNFNSGHDVIEDFGQGVASIAGSNWGTDHIDLSALGIHDLSQFSISVFDPTTHESTITFSSGNDVVVHSQVALTQHDFLFA
jgi:hypothetical protein